MTRIEHIESADSTSGNRAIIIGAGLGGCLLYTSDAADE